MRDVSLSFSGDLPGWVAFVVFAVAGLVVFWAYRRNRHRLSRSQAVILPLLRGALLVLLLGCLVEPVLSYRAAPESEAPVVFLVDVSKSMSIPDGAGGRPRLEDALAPWVGPQDLAQQLDRKFTVDYYAFDAGTRPLAGRTDLEAQQPSGEMTLIGEALASAAAQTESEELAGVVLLTDGANQSAVDPVAQARNLGAPVYVVAVGDVAASHAGKPDLSVTDVLGERFMSVNAENELGVCLNGRGYAGQTATVDVFDGEQLLATETAELTEVDVTVRLQITPTVLGKRTFEVVARPFDTEEITENNRRQFSAIVEKNHLAVLYVEGTPRWEYKFLKRALERDPVVRFTGFIRGRSDLFVRQGERVGEGVLPVTAEEFAAFDVIVVGDVSPRLFSKDQLEALREVVVEQGKGLALVPGPRARDEGGFGRTPLAEVVPSFLTAAEDYTETGEFVPRLTARGREHPMLAGLGAFFDASSAAALNGCFVLDEPGPGATALLAHPFAQRSRGPLPLCVTQVAGKGRAMAMAMDTTWRWRMNAVDGDARPLHARFWGQAIRWLAGGREDSGDDMPFIAYTSRDYYEPGAPSIVYARLPGAIDDDAASSRADAFAEPEVAAEVRTPSGAVLTTPLEFVAGSAGLYKVILTFTEPGEYTAQVSAVRGGDALGEDDARFFIGRPYGEFERIEMNERLLRALAFETGGAFYTPATASGIPDDLLEVASQRGIYVETRFARLPAVYIAMVVCAAVEWFLRKRRGLM